MNDRGEHGHIEQAFCSDIPPDLELRTLPGGKLQVELRGLDVYDPTTGEIRSSSTDDIACWFIDSDYNEESFFVRHAYFTGANEPYGLLAVLRLKGYCVT